MTDPRPELADQSHASAGSPGADPPPRAGVDKTPGQSARQKKRRGPNQRRVPLVGHRWALGAAVAAAIANMFIIRSQTDSGVGMAASCLFMAVFTYVGIRIVSAVRASLKPDAPDPSERDPGAAPVAGGWANPTTGQNFSRRLRKLFSHKNIR